MAKDSLSALLDGECSSAELDRILDEMERSPELKDTWSRLCMSRDASEGVRIHRQQRSICDGVMSRLDQREPVRAKVVPLVGRRFAGNWKPLAGLALAASVGAVAVTLGFNTREADPVAAPGYLPAQVSAPVSVPGAQRRPRYLQTVAASSEDLQRAVIEDELRNYLIEHSYTLADRGMGGTLSYARFAAHSVVEPGAEPVSAVRGDQP